MTEIGTVLALGDVAVAELAAGPLDLVWLDLEHGALDVRDVQAAAIAAQGSGCAAHVRLPASDSERLAAVLDAGVDGVVAPRVEQPGEVAALVARLRYPPGGIRGYGPRRAGGYGRSQAVEGPCLTVQIETPEGVEHVAAIAAVPGVDAIVVGCADLGLALGNPGDLSSGPLRAAVEAAAAASAAAGVRFGLAAGGDPAAIAALAAGRADLVIYSVDVRLFAAAIDHAASGLAAALDGDHVTA
jgi:2-keto-3-deoxy-L-rhamnonate aldolase RhmA